MNGATNVTNSYKSRPDIVRSDLTETVRMPENVSEIKTDAVLNNLIKELNASTSLVKNNACIDSSSLDNEKILSELQTLDFTKFQREIFNILIMLKNAANEDYIAQASMKQMFSNLSRQMVINTQSDICAQGNSALIQGVTAGVVGGVLHATGGVALGMNKDALGQSLVGFGRMANELSTGVSRKMELKSASDQKLDEHEKNVSDSLFQSTNEDKQRLKEFMLDIIKTIQSIIDDQKQASDAAAMKC